ncbi:DUF882 domain-containing protein [bacterium]|nr:DUF882 domain-containing protein [bacterium]
MTTKHKLAAILLALLLVSSFSSPAHASKRKLGDGILIIHNVHLNETVAVNYRNFFGYDRNALKQIASVLRCRKTNEAHKMRPQLIELVDEIADHFGSQDVYVVSGYRSPEFNLSLWKSGHHVSKDSPHMYGQAMDIRIPGVSPEAIRDYARALNRGGVGYYKSNAFVHVDVGVKQYWAEN